MPCVQLKCLTSSTLKNTATVIMLRTPFLTVFASRFVGFCFWIAGALLWASQTHSIQSVNWSVVIIFNHVLFPIADCVCVYLGRGIFHNSSSLSRPLARNVTQRLRPHGRIPLIPPTKSFRPPSVYRNSTFNRKKGIKRWRPKHWHKLSFSFKWGL